MTQSNDFPSRTSRTGDNIIDIELRLAVSATFQAIDQNSADIAELIEVSRRNSEGINALLEISRRHDERIAREDAYSDTVIPERNSSAIDHPSAMQLSRNATIAPAKLTQYLLVFRLADDKSKFLAQAGYGQENWQQLEADLRTQILPLPAVLSDEPNRFGDVYEIRGGLTGPNGVTLRVVTIWMVESETAQTKFVTLYPEKGG